MNLPPPVLPWWALVLDGSCSEGTLAERVARVAYLWVGAPWPPEPNPRRGRCVEYDNLEIDVAMGLRDLLVDSHDEEPGLMGSVTMMPSRRHPGRLLVRAASERVAP